MGGSLSQEQKEDIKRCQQIVEDFNYNNLAKVTECKNKMRDIVNPNENFDNIENFDIIENFKVDDAKDLIDPLRTREAAIQATNASEGTTRSWVGSQRANMGANKQWFESTKAKNETEEAKNKAIYNTQQIEDSKNVTDNLEDETRNYANRAGDFKRSAESERNNARDAAYESKYHEYNTLQNELASLESSLKSENNASESEKHELKAKKSEIIARLNALRTELQKLKTEKNFNDTSGLITAAHSLGNNVAEHYNAKNNLNELSFNVDQLLSRSDSDSEPFNNIFNNIMTSSFKEGLTNSDTQENLLTKIISNISEFVNNNVQGVNKAIDIRKKFTDTELLMQDDNIMSNMLMDYLINEDEGTNVEKVYNKLNQEARDKVRKIQVNNYQTKLYKEYIFMLKIIIFVSLLIVPLLLLNKLELLSYSITIVIIVVLVTLTALFIGHRIILLNSRDSINYDKFRMNFDRENAELLKKTGALYSKKSPLSSLNLTCIGDDCCDASMSYDNLRNKCILNENFNNIFEEITNVNHNNPNKINVIHQNDLHENNANFSNYEGFITGDLDTEKAKNELFINSLNRTTKDKF